MASSNNKSLEDLDDLLNSALEDFDNPKQRKTSTKKSSIKKDAMDVKRKAKGLQEKLQKIQELPPNEREEMIKEQLMGALKQMNVTSEQLTDKPPTEEELNILFQSLGADGANEDTIGLPKHFDNLLPMMEGVMESLMSKELLYPPMKASQKVFYNST